MKNLKLIFGALLFLFSSVASAAIITDIVNVDEYVHSGWLSNTASYTHDLTDDGFVLGSALSGSLEIEIYDDSNDWFGQWESSTISIDGLNFLNEDVTTDSFWHWTWTSDVTVSDFDIDINLDILAELNADGLLDVSVSSNYGDFWVGNSVLTVETADAVSVPEPSIIALFGMGLIGLGFARKQRKA